ncbi:hypothetical protein B0H13DRAFT_2306656 [Mycena leptocephala]|nr:hypothetical protein B0H13DRAFT_2306656 [Mycena leptocephala]
MCVVKYFCYEGSLTFPSPAYSTSSLPFTQHHPRQLAFVLHRDSSSFSLFSGACFALTFPRYFHDPVHHPSQPHTTFYLSPCTPAYAASPGQLLCQPTHGLSTIADHAALRDNVLFGWPFEEERRYRRGRIIEHSCLLPDLRSHADGDLTERPKVIDLSASEYRPRRVLQCGRRRNEDPLSAVDANVGKGFPSPIHLRGFFRGSGFEEFALLPLFLPTIPHDFRRWDDSTTWSFFGVLITMIRKCRANFVARLLVSLRQYSLVFS